MHKMEAFWSLKKKNPWIVWQEIKVSGPITN